MQDRFMVYGSRSPIEWALKLRAYGRGIQDRMTAQGFILWSDDGNTVSLKSSELHIPSLRWFLRDQVEAAQNMLEKLLLVSRERGEGRDTIPTLHVHDLKDDASIDTPGWCFLNDSRNAQVHGKEL